MKKIFLWSLVVLVLSLVLLVSLVWWNIVTGYSVRAGVVPVLVNVLTATFVTVFTYRSAVERDEQRFRRELLDKFLDEAGHWAYFPEGDDDKLKGKTRGGYKTGLFARYHRIHAGIEDESRAGEFHKRFEEFRRKVDESDGDCDQIEKAIEGMAEFLRENYLK